MPGEIKEESIKKNAIRSQWRNVERSPGILFEGISRRINDETIRKINEDILRGIREEIPEEILEASLKEISEGIQEGNPGIVLKKTLSVYWELFVIECS